MTSILVTRPAGSRDELVGMLELLGYRVHAVPTIAIEPLRFEAGALEGCDWIVVTSVHGVHALKDLPAGPRFAAVGEKTAGLLRARGVEPSHIPETASGAALAESMPEVAGKRIALVRASAASDDLPELLRRRGATVDEITAYRTVEGPEASREALRAALADRSLAAVVFGSGSAVRGFLALGGEADRPAVTIGPRTSAVAREHGFEVIAEAAGQDAASLAAAVAAAVPLEEEKEDA